MAMVVKNNMSAVKTLNTLNKNSSALQKSLAKVSSGMKINSAQDDASGYAISERMRVQIRSLDQANQNTQNASSLMKTAEGAVSSTMEILKTLKEKAVNAATDTNTDADRATIQKELNQFIDQIDDNALTTFNGKYLVDGSKSQAGSDTATTMTNESLGLVDVDGNDLGGSTKLTALTNRNSESLEINSTDSITASFVMNGKTYTTTYKVADTTLENVFENLNAIEDENGDPINAFGQGNASGASGSSNSVDYLDGVTAQYSTAAAAIAGYSMSDLQNFISTAPSALSDSTSSSVKQMVKTLQSLTDVASSLSTAENNLATNIANGLTAVNATTGRYWYYGVGTYNATTNAGADAASTNNGSTLKAAMGTYVANALKTSGSAHSSVVNAVKSESSYNLLRIAFGGNSGAIGNLNPASQYYSSNSQAINDSSLDNFFAYTLLSEAKTKADSIKTTGTASTPAQTTTSTDELVVRSDQVGINAFGDPVYTADEETGLTVTAAVAGIQHQISGLTLSITDSEGNVKKSANAALDAFRTTIYAKNHSEPNELTFQVGAKANQSITVGLDDMRAEALGLKGSDGTKISVATQDKANAAIAVFDNAIQKVLDHQATIGAIEARLEYTSQNLTTSSENVQAAESTIRDADMAKEMTEYTKNNVLLQAAQSMLAQANQNSSAVLSLLQ